MTTARPGPADWPELFREFDACRDFATLQRLCRAAARIEKASGVPASLVPARVALVGGATLDLVASGLRLALLARGVRPEMHVGGYDQSVREMTDPGGALAAFRPNVVVAVNTPFNLGSWPAIDASRDEVEALVRSECESILRPCRAIHETTGCEVILNTLHAIPQTSVGNLGAKLPGDRRNFVRRLNVALGDAAPAFVHLNDVAAMAEDRGLGAWFDLRYWYHAKQPLAFDAVPDYVRSTAAIAGALLGRTRKCVVLDLDDTLWGGILGDEGVAGVDVGAGTPRGEAFAAFQHYLKRLRERGVLLAVASKNDDELARRAFTERPEMVLRLDDFVAFEARWTPKSDSLRAIAARVGIGLDSLVFVDDNPAERALVRKELPEVAVPELGDEPADFPAILDAGRFFETTSLTAEDRRRTETYRSRGEAADARAAATDMPSYLTSLEMNAVVRPFEEVSLPRIAQLTNKTNQFNLTTRRVTPSEVEAMASDPNWVTRSLRLADRTGDHGLVEVFFARRDGRTLVVEGWLMSCRVIARGAEYALFEDVLAAARELGVDEIVGIYRPTDRNSMSKDLYRDLGFTLESETPEETRWRLAVAGARAPRHHIRVDSTTNRRPEGAE